MTRTKTPDQIIPSPEPEELKVKILSALANAAIGYLTMSELVTAVYDQQQVRDREFRKFRSTIGELIADGIVVREGEPSSKKQRARGKYMLQAYMHPL